MTLVELLDALKQNQVHVFAEAGQLRIKAPKGALTPALKEQLKAHKAKLLDFLGSASKPAAAKAPAMEKADRNQPIPLSFAQQRLWFIDQLDPGNPAYNVLNASRVTGYFDGEILQRALDVIVERHEILRTAFPTGPDDQPIQHIHPVGPAHLIHEDFTNLPSEEGYAKALKSAHAEAQFRFDLGNGPIFRSRLIKLAEDDHVLLINMHHIISDGWSMNILMGELAQHYGLLARAGTPAPLKPLQFQYADFSLWQQQWLEAGELERQLGYWKTKLEATPALLELPTDKPRPKKTTLEGAQLTFEIPAVVGSKLNQLTQKHGATLFMSVLAAFKTLLARYSNQSDILIGTPIANRNRSETEGLIGFFANTLVLRTDFSNRPTFNQLIQQVNRTALEGYDHQDVPFERIVDELDLERNLSYNPLFQVMFMLQSAGKESSQTGPLKFETIKMGKETSHFDLKLNMVERDGSNWVGKLDYNTDIFVESTIKRMTDHFQMLLRWLVDNPDHPVQEAPLLTPDEHHQMMGNWNNTQVDYPPFRCVHELFEAQVQKHPDRIAVADPDQRMTYWLFNQRTNQLAHHLRERYAVGPDVLVGICMARSVENLVALMAILKAGGGYVPMDEKHPKDRLELIAKDASIPVILSKHEHAQDLPLDAVPALYLDNAATPDPTGLWADIADCATSNPRITELNKHHLAYAIYTSGSTGMPKGVMLEHAQVLNYTLGAMRRLEVEEGLSYALVSTFAADLGNTSIFGSFILAGTLHILPAEISAAPDAMARYVAENQIDVIKMVPTHLRALLDSEEPAAILPRKLLVLGGEACTSDLIAKVQSLNVTERLYNHYGPSEATVGVCAYPIKHQVDPDQGAIPLGRPFGNLQLYVLNSAFNLLPVGIPGELCIAGDSLARGYLNRPDQTAERFVPNPFSKKAGSRMYRTGDLVRYLPDGNVVFMGRIDHQVKIRGFRIELGEIEAAITQHDGVNGSVVMAREDDHGEKRVVAWVEAPDFASNDDAKASFQDALRANLLQRLPDYMVPSALVILERIPLTANGKIDRRKLPAPTFTAVSSQDFVAASTPAEQEMVRLWADILKLPEVGMKDNFFDLGGHSLLAARLMARTRRTYNIEAPLGVLFENPTPAKLLETVLRIQTEQADGTILELKPLPRDGSGQPLSFAQNRLWFIDQLDPGNPVYNIPMAIEINGDFSADIMSPALDLLVERHESLRTTFAMGDDAPLQFISEPTKGTLKVINLQDCDDLESELQNRVIEASNQRFDLEMAPPWECQLLVLGPQRHAIVFVMHHIISDGWSNQILARDLGAFCDAVADQTQAHLPPLPIQYADFASWQRDWLEGGELERQLGYWKEQLAAPTTLELPTDRPRPRILTHIGDRHLFPLREGIQEKMQALAEKTQTTPFMITLAAFQLLLSRYSGQPDILVGTPIANRSRAELEGLIGFFVNTLVMRANFSETTTFSQVLAQIRDTALKAYSHQDLPFEKLVEEMKLERDLGRNPLFQVVFTYKPREGGDSNSPVTMKMLEYERGMAHFDIHLTLNEVKHGINGLFSYNTDLFDAATMARMGLHYATLLFNLVEQPDAPLQSIEMLPDKERTWLLEECNHTQADYPESTIADLFEEQAAADPQAMALLAGPLRITYGALNARANQIARALMARGVGPETTVGLVLERSHEMVASILGVLKAGGAFVPIDVNLPPDRIAFILDNAKIRYFVTQAKMREHLEFAAEGGFEVLDLDKHARAIRALPMTNPTSRTHPDSLCYIMFTSGSTGTPKGVAAVNRGVVRLVKNTNFANLDKDQTFMLYAPVFFDASTLEIWGALLNGGRLAIAPAHAVSLQELGEVMQGQGVTTMWLTAGLFHQMVDEHLAGLSGLKQLLAGGDALALPQVRRVLDELDGVTMINGYGPTENTTFTTCHTMTSSEGLQHTVPIGTPINNTSAYILDPNFDPVATGMNGELYTGGAGLARGYMNRPDLTAERFVPNPYAANPGGRMYKTGDIVKRRTDGTIEFVGRRDFQVKLRGFRIELGEIEAVLNEHPLLKTTLVLLREDMPGDKRLVAYLLHQDDADLSDTKPATAAIRSYLEEKLPAFMVPSAFIWLESFPLNANGKVDRKKLPTPERKHLGLEDDYVAPRNATEEALVEIWESLLTLERVGATDHFFEVGGHSLLATRLVSKIRETFEVELPLREIFELPTVAMQAKRISELTGGETSGLPRIVPIERTRPIPLSFAQQRLWVIDQMEPGNPAYNIYRALQVTGPFDKDLLEQAFNHLIERHEALRTTFCFSENRPWQVVHQNFTQEVRYDDLTHLHPEKAWQQVAQLTRTEAGYRFDMAHGPLIRLGVIQVEENEQIMQLCMHHIISDGWSMGILIGELTAIYAALAQGQEPYLQPLPVQYADYAFWQRDHLEGAYLEEQIGYWQEQLADIEPLNLPTDHPRPRVQTNNGKFFRFRLEANEIQPLYELGRQRGATPFMTLLAAFKVLLSRYCNTPDIVIGTPVSGRNRGEVEPLIGFFVNTLVLRTNLSDAQNFLQAVDAVHESALSAFSHQDVTFERLVEALQLPRDTSRNPVFDVMFSYHSGRQNLDPGTQQEYGDLTFASYGTARESAQFDLTLNASENGDAVSCTLEYNTDLFDEETIASMAEHLRQFIKLMREQPEKSFRQQDYMMPEERQKLLVDWNGKKSDRVPVALPTILEKHAMEQPDVIAVAFSDAVGGHQLSYEELNRRANQLAHWLIEQGLQTEAPVALYLERTFHLPVCMWASLKAGGCFMILDRNHPEDRRTFMLEDTQAPFVLTSSEYYNEISEDYDNVYDLDALFEKIADHPTHNPQVDIDLNQHAYVIYTSGSTGRPKGVGVTHCNLTNFSLQCVHTRSVTSDDVCLQFAALSFDISVSEQFNGWTGGATVAYRDESCMEGLDKFTAFIEQFRVSIFDLPTAFWNAWVYALEHGGIQIPGRARLFIIGGEKAERDRVEAWFKHGGTGREYLNSYGPTEVTIDSVNFTVTSIEQVPKGLVPIGIINPDYTGYVLDSMLQLVAPGVSGELVLGGKSVARGYINRPDLTANAFVPDPYGDTPGARMYRTGDLVRFNNDGLLVYLGRIDFQVKIRGFRIEPGEIEALLAKLEQVSQVIVSARKDPNNQLRLVAHIESGKAYTSEELSTYLHNQLPEYMVPDAFVVLEEFPLTTGGKVNRKALPDPEYASSDNYVAPRDAVETALAAVWADVLGMQQVGIYDNFFENGGHSLLATVLVGRIRQELQVDVPLTAVFEAPTVLAMAQIVNRLQAEGKRLDLPPIEAISRDGALPLSFSQQRLWFIDQLDPGNRAYLMPQTFEVRGPFDPAIFTQAINAVVARHESLRTYFVEAGGEATQVVIPEVTLDVPLIDLTEHPHEEREDLARQHISQAMNASFDLSNAPLIRAVICKLGNERHAVGVCMHHIVSDGWSHGVFTREVGAHFEALLTEQPVNLPPLKLHYPDFAAWQRNYLAGERLEKLGKYWQNQFAALPDPLEIPTDHPRPQMQTFTGDTVTVQLSAAQTDAIKKLSRDNSATDFMTLLAGFNALLTRYTSREDLLVGTPIAGRNHPETEGMIGFFVNTLVMRNDLSGNPSYRDIINRVKATALEAYTHQDMPFDMIVNDLGLPRDLGRNPLFQVMFVYNKVDDDGRRDDDSEMQFLPFNFNRQLAHFDLTLTISDHAKKGIIASFTFNSDLYKKATMQRLADHFQSLLAHMSERPDDHLYTKALLGAAEAETLRQWNATDAAYEQSNIQTVFDQTVARFPQRPAIVCAGEVVTYAELHERANRLAHVLIDNGIGLESHVGVALNRSVDLCVAFIAILKAGGTFVPLDANLPDDRIAFMLEATRTPLVIYDDQWLNNRAADLFEGRKTFTLADLQSQLANASSDSPQVDVHIDQLAYVMFTSGSTGQPKGVSVPHRGVLRLVRNNSFLPVDETKVWLMIAPTHFDASTLEIWGAFLNGGKLAIYQSRVPVLEELAEFIVENKTTHTFLTVALMHQMVESHLDSLRTFEFLSTGGDVFSPWHAAKAVAELPGVRVVNGYGPTENTTFTTTYDVPVGTTGDTSIPIGKPIGNTRTYVLDKLLHPVPVGIPGELYTSGDGLARCYAQRPDLTAERFLPDIFGDNGQRMYKTGDLVRFGKDGLIHFMGRLDFQVKIRGFRIELGEIETVLTKLEDVKDALVIAADDGHGSKRLVAYLTTDLTLDDQPGNAHMRERLSDLLPEYMVPAAFVWLATFPMTTSGKVDRRALPAPTITSEAEYVAPSSETEIALADIYADLLEQERVGLNDHFFELGGHSLIATRLVSRIRESFEVELPLRTVFEAPTVAGLAKRIDELAADPTAKLPAIVPVDRDRPIPLSFAQQRLWVIDQMDPGNPAYNIFMAYRVTGTFPVDVLEQAGQGLMQRHESLRTVFTLVDNQPQQEVRDFTLKVQTHDLREEADAEAKAHQVIDAESNYRYDLANGPLFRITHVQLTDDVCVLGIGMHHIISDGWSMGILMGELAALCAAVAEGEASPLPPLPVQYPDFAFWQREHLEGHVLDAQRDYWQTQLAGVEPLNLPTDFHRPRIKTNRGGHYNFKIPTDVIQPLFSAGKAQGATPFMSLLAGFKVLLARYANMTDITVGTPISGRTRSEVEPLIGFFVNTLVLRTDLSAQPSFNETLERVRQTTLAAFSHQDITFERIVEALKLPRDTSRNPVFDVMFSYHSAGREQVREQDNGDLKFEGFSHESATSQFDLTLNASEVGDQLSCIFEYSSELFEEATVAAMAEHLVNLLRALGNAPQEAVTHHNYMTDAQRERLLTTWNGVHTRQQVTTVHALFEAHVQSQPDALAAVFSDTVGGAKLTYAELNTKANQLAHWLIAYGVRNETVVALYLERTPHLPVAILATLKAGGCFMVLDRNHPEERRAFMLEDTEAPIILTSADYAAELADTEQQVVDLDAIAESLANQSGDAPSVTVDPEQLVYTIFTSGSTGRPKGVAITHRNLANYTRKSMRMRNYTPDDCYMQFAALSFDISMAEIFNAWTAGATLAFRDASCMEGIDKFTAFIEAHQVSILDLPTAFWHAWVYAVEHGTVELPQCVRMVIAGGDKAERDRLAAWFAHGREGITWINSYGPTEATIDAVNYPVTSMDQVPEDYIPIGKIDPDYTGYVADEHFDLTPPGVAGELLLGGDGVGRGYLKRPDLTAAAFIPDAFGNVAGRRLYRTGDLVRFGLDGNLIFMGRIDFQIKVRGYRIEPGEIEAQLATLEEVGQVVITTLKDNSGQLRIVAYLETAEAYDQGTLSTYLKGRMPEYMVPSAFVCMETFPITPSGKIDRRALPEPTLTSETPYVAPRNDVEEGLCQIFSALLSVAQVGIHDNFFELGGHSLLATQLMAIIHKEMGVKLPMALLFQQGTVAGLALAIAEEGQEQKAWTPLISINNQTQGQPLFIVHPVGGGVLSYRDLGQNLADHMPVYALEAQGLEQDEPLDDFETMAERYLEAIQTVQPEGPYLLAGWSLGGVVAWEMARQLEANQQVSHLVLIDSYATITDRYYSPAEIALSFVRDYGRLIGEDIDIGTFDVENLPEDMETFILDKFEEQGAFETPADRDRIQRQYRVFAANLEAAGEYEVEELEQSEAHLIVASEAAGDDHGWDDMIDEEAISQVEGNHYTMLQEKSAEDLAKTILKQRNKLKV